MRFGATGACFGFKADDFRGGYVNGDAVTTSTSGVNWYPIPGATGSLGAAGGAGVPQPTTSNYTDDLAPEFSSSSATTIADTNLGPISPVIGALSTTPDMLQLRDADDTVYALDASATSPAWAADPDGGIVNDDAGTSGRRSMAAHAAYGIVYDNRDNLFVTADFGDDLLTNTALSDWTTSGTGSKTWDAGALTIEGNGYAAQNITTVVGRTYRWSIRADQTVPNLVTNADFATGWSTTGISSVTFNQADAFAAANGAATLLPSSGGTFHFARYSFGSSAIGSIHRYSVYAKASGYNFLFMGDNIASGAGSQRGVYFDLANGTVGSTDDNGTGDVLGATIEQVGGGFFLCTVTFVASSGHADIAVASADGTRSFSANGTDSIIITGQSWNGLTGLISALAQTAQTVRMFTIKRQMRASAITTFISRRPQRRRR